MMMLSRINGRGRRRNTARSQGSAISTSGLTKIGDMTAQGGLAAAFDGTTSQAGASSAGKSTSPGYVGVTFTAPTRVFAFDTYGGNNTGYDSSGNPSLTLDIYGKAGSAPANSTDGTLLATQTFTDTAVTDQRAFVSTDNETLYDHVWVRVSTSAPRVAELVIYESV